MDLVIMLNLMLVGSIGFFWIEGREEKGNEKRKL